MVELANSKDTTKTGCSDLGLEDLMVHTKFCAMLQKSRAKSDKISTSDDGGYMIPIHSKIGQGMRIHFEKLVNSFGKNELTPVHLENNIFNFPLESRSEINRDQCERC